jgi:predicted amidohydrolase
MTIAAAQTIPNDGNIEANISDHCRLAEAAAKEGAQLILFPEMSLTGYQRERAGELAFFEHDARLQRLRNVATNRAITIVAGAPIRMVSGLHIGAFIIAPGKSVSVYTKQYLHDGEAAFFTTSSGNDAQIKIANE